MTLSDARKSIGGTFWTLVLRFPDGEFGCVDAEGRIAEQLMTEQAAHVVGIYRKDQARYLRRDVERAVGPAWANELAA